jgi:DnaJ homolog subfamily B member 11
MKKLKLMNILVQILIIFVFLNEVSLGANRDFYKILNVKKSATLNEIKKAYRKMAKEQHPDKNPDDPKASEKFADLTAAYEVLSNADSRKLYDRCGEECVKKEGMMSGDMDPFASFFGDFGFNFGGQEQRQEVHRGANIVMDVYASLEEMYNGNFIEVSDNKFL